jgi:hypothetical protein
VTFEVDVPLKAPDACHCTACRKHSGHVFVSTDVPRAALKIAGADRVTWYRSSEKVRRGFCGTCGASLFFDPVAASTDWIGVAMGAFDGPTGTRIGLHVFVAEKGDYYAIDDGAPQHARWPEKPPQ